MGEAIESGEVRPEPCHRLDRHTTGILVVGLTAQAQELFRQALAEGRVRKVYEVVVWGYAPAPQWDCRIPLVRRDTTRRDRPRMVAAPADRKGALTAHTRFTALSCADHRSRLRAELVTGRTHQVRAHCLAEGLPVVGDPRYGRPGDATGDGQFLHAQSLRISLPDRSIEVECPWPTHRARWLRQWSLLQG